MSTPSVPSAPSRRRPVTIRDVARASGVSVATVTRALHGHPRVRPETRRRVEQAAVALGYRPDFNARALATGASRTIGLLVPSIGDRFCAEVAAGIEARAAEASRAVLLASSQHEPEREHELAALFLAKRVEGIIVASARVEPHDWFRPDERPVPVVLVNLDERLAARELRAARSASPRATLAAWARRDPPAPWLARLSFDDAGAAAEAVRHLLALGHERLAFVGEAPVRPAALRLLGFRLACAEAGVEPLAIMPCELTLEGGRRAATELLQRRDRPTAIVAYDDVVAIGTMRAAHALGLHVPDDVALVGFDDIDIAAFVEPPLTTVRQQKEEMGRLAVELLLRGLESDLGLHDTLTGELVVRGSSLPRRGAAA